jgi:predicted RNA polymerase sigma factor
MPSSALMEIQASRMHTRIGPSGEAILLLDQNRAVWEKLLIRRGLAALERAERLGGSWGPYALQASIAACHAQARTPGETDWSASRPSTTLWHRSHRRLSWS